MIIQHKDGLQMAVQLKLIKAIGKSRLTECLENIKANGKEGSKNMFPTVLSCVSCYPRKEAFELCLAFVTYMTRDINDTFVTNPRMTGKPSFAGSWRNTVLISHIQHKTIYIFQK